MYDIMNSSTRQSFPESFKFKLLVQFLITLVLAGCITNVLVEESKKKNLDKKINEYQDLNQ